MSEKNKTHEEPESLTVKTKEVEVMNQDNWLVAKIKAYVKAKPKQAFTIMFVLVTLSVCLSIAQLIYLQRVEVPKYNEMKKVNIFSESEDSFSEPIKATQNVFEIREAIKELEYFRQKEELTRQDSIRIKYLIDKYQITPKK